jgi:hypothetical protein
MIRKRPFDSDTSSDTQTERDLSGENKRLKLATSTVPGERIVHLRACLMNMCNIGFSACQKVLLDPSAVVP